MTGVAAGFEYMELNCASCLLDLSENVHNKEAIPICKTEEIQFLLSDLRKVKGHVPNRGTSSVALVVSEKVCGGWNGDKQPLCYPGVQNCLLRFSCKTYSTLIVKLLEIYLPRT